MENVLNLTAGRARCLDAVMSRMGAQWREGTHSESGPPAR